MGGSESKQPQRKTVTHKNVWKDRFHTDDYSIVYDQNNREGQQYEFWLNPKRNPEEELKIYQQRNAIDAPIIKTLSEAYDPRDKGFANINSMSVISERIPYKLSVSPQLSYPQSLYVLDQSLQGFDPLYRKVGCFEVRDEMIGFNPKGQCRVWFNSNYGKNEPERKRGTLKKTRSYESLYRQRGPRVNQQQSHLVRNIISVVQGKCEEGRFPEHLKDHLYSKHITFYEARQRIKDEIAAKNLIIPNKLDLFNNTVERKVLESAGQRVQTKQMVQKTVINPPVNAYQKTTNYATSFPQQTTQINQVRSAPKLKFNYQQPKQYFHPNIYKGA